MAMIPRLFPGVLVLLLGTFLLAAPARAEEFEVQIHHTEVLNPGISPRVGDVLSFVNHAEIAHNLYLTYEDGTVVTLDTQPPGTTKRAMLKQAGHVIVRCWIHPIIRMEFDVAPH
ncbi:methylamine utilization protein MauL [Ancylobacter sp. 6x-1]|uniref:Methylamine utilization protein MauL n=1 Tax=Ancylobacter crimeensis TaxID=2579147 RepID=A0ABT0DD88_9HYPH|nr:methylamine utilization protein MauL [Ancylobacter crimeensis]MCK0197915.1 methylamine utilization protein MauL [Ancylobacter crimeensis]